MNGVEILSSNEVTIDWIFNWKACWIGFAVAFGIAVITNIPTWFKDWSWAHFIDFVVMVVFVTFIIRILIGGLSGAIWSIPTKYETQYKATISDEVKMVDFLERYEIVDQEGKIYTIREIG
jgi:hypothetical protein